jgi:transcriptional regulator with GAF, ATPase, and Fis domain
MAAIALQPIAASRYYIRLDSSIAGRETGYSFLLDASRHNTDSQTAVIYGFQPETSELNAIAARSSATARVKDAGVTLSAATSRWFESLTGPAQGTPSTEPNFEKFPEVLQYQLKRLIVVPLRTENDVFGLLTLGRLTDDAFDQPALESAHRAGRVLTAVLERDSLQQKLLQQRRRLSEAQAYHLLHNNSRRRRMPMANLAKEIIETHRLSQGAR